MNTLRRLVFQSRQGTDSLNTEPYTSVCVFIFNIVQIYGSKSGVDEEIMLSGASNKRIS